MAEAKDGVGKWIVGGAAGLLAVIGLLAASRAADEAFYVGGLVLAAAAVAYIFWMIGRSYDQADAEYARQQDGATRH